MLELLCYVAKVDLKKCIQLCSFFVVYNITKMTVSNAKIKTLKMLCKTAHGVIIFLENI